MGETGRVTELPRVVERAADLAEAYAEAFALTLRACGDQGSAHFAALKAMEIAGHSTYST